MSTKVTVLGAGNGGQALAANLSLSGCNVSLFEHPEFREAIKGIIDSQRIKLEGEIEGEAHVKITTDANLALDESEVIFVVVPAFAQEKMWKLLGKSEKARLVVFVPDNYASLEFFSGSPAKKDQPILAGTSTLPYACRAQQGVVTVSGVKKTVLISAVRSQDNEALKGMLSRLPLNCTIAQSIIEANLSNLNMIVHCATALMNAGKIERAEKFRFYWEGITPSIAQVLETLDNERTAIEEKLGLKARTILDLMEMYYGVREKDVFQTLTTAKVYGGLGYDAPRSLKHRYFSEDIPYALVPLSKIGKMVNVRTPVADSIILLASTLNRTDYRAIGNERVRNLNNARVIGAQLVAGSGPPF